MQQVISTLKSPLALAIVASVVLLAVGEILSPGFAQGGQIMRLLTVAALLGIVAAGQNLVILGGRAGIDLSVGAMVSWGAVLAGNAMQGADGAIGWGLAMAVVVPTAVGIVNGLGVTALRIPPLVMTLGMTAVLQGGLVVYSQGVPSGRAAPALADFVNTPLLLGVPGIVFVWMAIGLAMAWLLTRTRLGLAIYALGSNERAARLVGLPVAALRVALYGFSGFFAGLTGFLLIGYTGTSFISVGDQYVLPAIIAVVIGGTSLAGGSGHYWGTMAGAVALTILQSVLITLNLEFWARQMVFGVTLLGLMLLYGRQMRLRI